MPYILDCNIYLTVLYCFVSIFVFLSHLLILLLFKVVGKAQATKSNLHIFWYRCLVLALIDVSKVLAQTLHDCMTYERKEKPKIHVKFKVQLIN